jgi:ADP-ribosylation factor GTPase-activating protein 2/3
VVITDNVEGTEGGDTPVEDEDDFFSSWSRPAVKKLSPPISRTATPPVVGRTPSPFLNAQIGKDTARSPSPLAKGGAESEAKPASSRITTSAAIRSSATGPRKANILGAKKVTSKLGAKKLGGDVLIDFDEAEKKAKEEAERIEKLGYDPDADEETPAASKAAGKTDSAIVSPTPVSPVRGYSHSREKSASEMERLGMGMKRLGFGQVGKPAGAAAAAKKGAAGGGFGSVGPIKASAEGKPSLPLPTHPQHTPTRFTNNYTTDDGENYARKKFGTQKAISSDEFFGKGIFESGAQAEAKSRLQGFEGAQAISSNAYFGRNEEDERGMGGGGGSMGGGMGGEDYGDLETAAKDFVRRFGITAADDLENLSQLVGEGAGRLQGAIRAYLGS